LVALFVALLSIGLTCSFDSVATAVETSAAGAATGAVPAAGTAVVPPRPPASEAEEAIQPPEEDSVPHELAPASPQPLALGGTYAGVRSACAKPASFTSNGRPHPLQKRSVGSDSAPQREQVVIAISSMLP
jgi:hypothetical protein